MSLICPKCLADMTQVEHQGVGVDLCPGCRGIWLDPGELAQLRSAETDLPTASATATEGPRALQTSTFICPRCQGGFDTFEYAPGTELYIDRCKDCKGIYLDAGELHKIRSLTSKRRVLGLESPREPDRRLREMMERERARWSRERREEPRAPAGPSAGTYFFQLLTGMPVEVDARRSRFPVATLGIILVCALAFLYQILSVGDEVAFYRRFAFVPADLWWGESWIGLFTGIFLHGGLLHLLGNMYFLWVFGDNVEERLHRGIYLLFYLVCGIAASLIHGALTDTPQVPTLGASGAISGIMGAYLVLYPKRRMYQIILFMQFQVSVTFYLLFWLGLQLLFSAAGSGGVAWFAHVGGFAAGAAGIWLLGKAGMVAPEPRPGLATTGG